MTTTKLAPLVTTVAQAECAARASLSVANANTPEGGDYFRGIQIGSTQAGEVTFLARTQTVVMRSPITVNWKNLGFAVPMARWMREQVFDVPSVVLMREQVERLVELADILTEKKAEWGRDDFRQQTPVRLRETLARLEFPEEGDDWIEMGIGKMHAEMWPVGRRPLLCTPHAFNPRYEAVQGLLGDVTAPLMEAMKKVWALTQAAFPGATVQYSTARLEGEWLYYFDIMLDGARVADGLVEPASIR